VPSDVVDEFVLVLVESFGAGAQGEAEPAPGPLAGVTRAQILRCLCGLGLIEAVEGFVAPLDDVEWIEAQGGVAGAFHDWQCKAWSSRHKRSRPVPSPWRMALVASSLVMSSSGCSCVGWMPWRRASAATADLRSLREWRSKCRSRRSLRAPACPLWRWLTLFGVPTARGVMRGRSPALWAFVMGRPHTVALPSSRAVGPMGRSFALRPTVDDGGTVLWASGELDLAGVEGLLDAVLAALGEGKPVVVDLSALGFLDSSGIGALVKCRNEAVRLGCHFRVRGAAGEVARVLTVTGMLGPLADPDS
jgi:anti-sigma B factor antagonist